MSEQHAKFQQRFRESAPAVFAYVQHLSVQGVMIDFPPVRVAPTAAEAAQYADSGDIFVLVRKRYEIKGLRKTMFTGRADWPHPHFFVDRLHRAKSEADHVALWVYLNNALTHYATIKPGTRRHWYETTTRNSETGNVEDYMACPLELVDFHELSRWGDQCSSAHTAAK